ncbi:hypothetical protein Cgig2_004168 [Carnegiea gigantea]|uniref:BHLH domain-containing protein n=1 Tax=Carnegiea gigantea TaxID=171969 RepID=A0A9Q1QNC5_9CARY|nr:hypothetical protein Cgig2_004166 [Carnegiea gigantea]KAJ8449113.1 hypothetical protein Cgig2_004168 [Carnegiea gigantea]
MANNDGRPSPPSLKKPQIDRRIVERNRRIQMNHLCSQLASLLPPRSHFNPSQKRISQADQIEQARHYVIELRERLEQLRQRKEQLGKMMNEEATPSNVEVISDDDEMMVMMDANDTARLPIIQIIDLGGAVEVHLVTSPERDLKLGQVIRVLEEEGAEVENCTFSIQGDKVFHNLHAKVF